MAVENVINLEFIQNFQIMSTGFGRLLIVMEIVNREYYLLFFIKLYRKNKKNKEIVKLFSYS